jgi:magnesium transporter
MIRSFAYDRSGKVRQNLDEKGLRRALRSKTSVVWVDFDEPTLTESALLDDVFGFHPLSIEDCLHASEHPKVDDFGTYVFVVFLAPDKVLPGQEELDFIEVDLFLGPNFVVTYHKRPTHAIDATLDRARRLSQDVFGRGADFLFHDILDRIVDQYLSVTAHWDRAADQYENRILDRSGHQEVLQEVLDFKRGLLDLRQNLVDHRNSLDQLLRASHDLLSDELRIYLSNIRDHLERTLDEADLCRDSINSARDLYLSILSQRTNEVMRVLALVATVMLPLTFIASLYGMNVDLPGGLDSGNERSPYSFHVLIGIMISIAVAMIGVFRWKKWL